MTRYSIATELGPVRYIPAEDLLGAVKYSKTYEAALYDLKGLIVNWFNLSLEENLTRLLERGIQSYHVNDKLCFRYLEEMKQSLYAHLHIFYHENIPHLQVIVRDYRSLKSEIKVKDLNELYTYLATQFDDIEDENKSIALFNDDGFTSHPMPKREMVLIQ